MSKVLASGSHEDEDFGEAFWFRMEDPHGNWRPRICSPHCYHCPHCTGPCGFHLVTKHRSIECPWCGVSFRALVEPLYVGKSLAMRADPSNN